MDTDAQELTAAKSQKEKLTSLENDIRRDFYLSFKYSQGDPDLQDLLNIFVLKHCTQEQLQGIYDKRDKIKGSIMSFMAPKEHTLRDNDERIKTLEEEWHRYLWALEEMLGSPDPLTPSPGSDEVKLSLKMAHEANDEKLLRDIAIEEVKRDSLYVTYARPNRYKPGSDEHESFLKTYGFESHLTDSPIYDELFLKLKAFLISLKENEEIKPIQYLVGQNHEEGLLMSNLKFKLLGLEKEWQIKHPGQQFFAS